MDGRSTLVSSSPSAPSPRTLDELSAEITELAGHLNAAQHRWLTLIAEFDRREGWATAGCCSCAHWLNFQCGIVMGAAREKVRVARALEGLPGIAAAMARGALSYSKVRALTRVADPSNEETLLSIALHGTAHHVERLVQHFRRAQEAEELSREARQQAGRSVTYLFDDDGSMVLKARLPAEIGTLLIKALDAAVEVISTPRVPAGTSEVHWRAAASARGGEAGPSGCCHARGAASPTGFVRIDDSERPSFAARRADALGTLAESFLKHGGQALSGGERYQIVVHVDEQTLRESTPGQCEIEQGPALPAETVRRLSCDSSVVRLVQSGSGEPLDVGRRTRSIPPALRRALNAGDQGCRFPGCTHTRYVDAHHVRHWAQGGETKASNLVLLCRHHHRKVHEGGVRMEVLDDGAFRFVRPDGRAFDSVAPARNSDWTQLPRQHRQRALKIDAHTAATRWRGERMDYGLALEILFAQAAQAAQAGPVTEVTQTMRATQPARALSAKAPPTRDVPAGMP